MMADRFENGDTGQRHRRPRRRPAGRPASTRPSKGFYNGGDLEGLLDAARLHPGLGTDAIWLTPSFKNKAGPARGRAVGRLPRLLDHRLHPDRPAPRHQRRPQDARRRGARARDEGLLRHHHQPHRRRDRLPGGRPAGRTSPRTPRRTATPPATSFDDRDYAGDEHLPGARRRRRRSRTRRCSTRREQNLKVPAWLNDPTLYHNRGDTTFAGENSQYGDFFGLDDLFTEHPQVVDGMIDIYETWVQDFGIDGFRIDTMKHVNDEFWQEFGPGGAAATRTQHGKPDFFMFGEVALDGSGAAARASRRTTRPTTRCRRSSTSRSRTPRATSPRRAGRPAQLATFFANDDWYTDADSNAYQLPTFLGNHDMGRIGYFVQADNPGAGDAELLARDRLAHELMYFSRGNPVVYYGDEQGFTGSGGDQVARQTMFASQVPEYLDDDLLGTDRDPRRRTTSSPAHPLYQAISAARRAHRGSTRRCATAPSRTATPTDGPGVFAFSRIDRERPARVRRRAEQQRVGRRRRASRRTSRKRQLQQGVRRRRRVGCRPTPTGTLDVTVPPLSAVVYESDRPDPAVAARRRRSASTQPAPADGVARPDARRGRRRRALVLRGHLPGARSGNGGWQPIGTDDTAPYQVFHDVSRPPRRARTVQYRAVVLDNAGHTASSQRPQRRRAAPRADHRGAARGQQRARHRRGARGRRPRAGDPRGARSSAASPAAPWTPIGTDSTRRRPTRCSTTSRRWTSPPGTAVAVPGDAAPSPAATTVDQRRADGRGPPGPPATMATLHYFRPAGDYGRTGACTCGATRSTRRCSPRSPGTTRGRDPASTDGWAEYDIPLVGRHQAGELHHAPAERRHRAGHPRAGR